MDKKLIIFVVSSLLLVLFQNQPGRVSAAKIQASEEISSRKMDQEAEILADYLEYRGSPLKYHAQDFVDAANEYNLDWKMLPAIAGVESTFGKFTPGGYNAWGWGVYGTNAIYFKSWKEAIFTISKGLREDYFDRGLTNPYSINRVYAESKSWGRKVSFFISDLDRFEKSYLLTQTPDLAVTNPKIAAASGLLSLNIR